MNRVCVGMGWCGCMKDGRPLHVRDFIPRSGSVSAQQFAEWLILADGCNPSTPKWAKSKQKIIVAFQDIMGADVVEANELRWAGRDEYDVVIQPRNTIPKKITSVTLVVSDYDEAINFYVGSLGFVLVEDYWLDNHTKRWVRVAPPGAQTALLLAKANSTAQKAAIGNQTGGRVGFFLQTDDFARDHAAMLEKGVTFREAPRHEPYGTVAVFEDPFGNLWDLIEPKQKGGLR